MPKRRQGGCQANYCDRKGTKQKSLYLAAVTKQKSLYLVLDDWDKGYTIRKIDADNPNLMGPPVLRMVSSARGYAMKFAALGSNIIATSNQHAGTLLYDTDTSGLAIGHPIPDALLGGSNIFLSSGDTLFAFAFHHLERPLCFEVMTKTMTKDLPSFCPSTDWSWKSMPTPFTKDEMIFSYALHPDGHTIFVSSWSKMVYGTFSFNLRKCEWRRHGDWMLPFKGRGYFDGELDAWVGLHEDGYICSCQVASCSSSTMQPPDWKMVDEYKMWIPWHQVAKREGATLTYMGNARFCLIDCVAGDGIDFQDAFGVADGCVLHITTFHLRYDHEGKLRIIDRNTSSFPVSKHLTSFSPMAFWL